MTDMTDARPANCRNRLQDEGKPYPRSSCAGCHKTIMNGLGKGCGMVKAVTPEPPAAPVTCPYPAAYARGECCGGYCAMDDDAPAAPVPVPVREWKHGRARAVVMHDDDCFLWIVSDTPEDAAYLSRDQFASLLAAGPGLLAAMGDG